MAISRRLRSGIPLVRRALRSESDLLRASGAGRSSLIGSNQRGIHVESAAGLPTKTIGDGGKSEYFGIVKISSQGMSKNTICRAKYQINTTVTGMGINNSFSCAQVARRCFSSNADLPAHQEIGMPSLSPTMTEGNIARWLKKEGDKVSPGEVLCEVETDKATVEMECMEEGFLAKIVHGDGAQNIKVGEIIAITVEEEGDIDKFKDYKASASSEPAESKPSSEPTPKKLEPEPVKAPEPKVSGPVETSRAEDRIFISPLARKLAEDNNVPLSSIKGTGPDGRILKADIEDYLASSAKGSKVKGSPAAQALDYADITISQIRKVTASRLLLSKQTIPHYYLTVDTRVDKLMELRSQLNSLQEASGGKRLSVNDLVIKAAALALRKVPACNSSWMNDFIRQYHNVNINVAVQTDNGLFVPVIRARCRQKGAIYNFRRGETFGSEGQRK
ncbi:dihydrolipoyllysine-residue acetyltransferase component 2 of pyruvate dehydrogenase complex, mitochondrial-like isoform X1 [Iris pallida]|uniref:Dihydrolipoamide acetyltransferase component of pyruvate dehydrogenase complex n=1 Tax=Iris pallida TaxID=29817 RepID=A0AAX6EZ85_IRIPA|nr:dihydrolipoyllysine-residue acetyltransferase component 2 of pyruvate dehydrogenase complex, mitochondrial-like isoform X1 [Iris pallida]